MQSGELIKQADWDPTRIFRCAEYDKAVNVAHHSALTSDCSVSTAHAQQSTNPIRDRKIHLVVIRRGRGTHHVCLRKAISGGKIEEINLSMW